MNKDNKIDLLIGIVLIIFSVLSFIAPQQTFSYLSYLIAIILLIRGLYNIFVYLRLKNTWYPKNITFLIVGILISVLGIIFLLKPTFAHTTFSYVLAIWFIYDAINNFFSFSILKDIDFKLLITFITANALTVMCAILIFINPWISYIPLSNIFGIAFILLGVEHIIFSITGRKNSHIPNKITKRNLN
ncbi:HdeD family acid-resistance protein [Peptostreptococcus faecalis]|uniref:HdeD family acid-resistance protein n=1 Tax=Peptostreptococcus faecalis TaxID=2045015 RepID=UPI000C7B805F|nr:DUF308 domain-containing protein [Peptostreptococcus faecalis]